MQRLTGCQRVALALTILLAPVIVACSPMFSTVQCDGELPQWMLDAQDYDGGGCAQVLPSDQAPPNADWTSVCIGYCNLEQP